MRYIKQRFLSKCLNGRRHNPPATSVAAKKAWRRTNKKDIRKACYKQQHGLCAYTELSLDNTELGCHLEHIAPRSHYPERTFVPHNIILSIMDDVKSGHLQPHEKFGGHHKSEEFADEWFISPFNMNCSAYFRYDLTGLVKASDALQENDKEKANKTISVLNLNAAYLVERRGASLESLKAEIEALAAQHYDLKSDRRDFFRPDSQAHTDLAQLASATLELRDRMLPEFYSAKRQLFASFGVA